ncbi:MAG: HisA/HisF-related TIM barrel protein, partial [Verrucomicrobiota bacterium]
KFTELKLDRETLEALARNCDEFLIHAADVEGLCRGVDLELVKKLGDWTPIPTTYAGGAKSLEDLLAVTHAGKNRVHLTIGSALDIFGGSGVRYDELVAYNRTLAATRRSAGVPPASF